MLLIWSGTNGFGMSQKTTKVLPGKKKFEGKNESRKIRENNAGIISKQCLYAAERGTMVKRLTSKRRGGS